MEEQFLNEILKDTFTLEVFKRRYQALTIELQGKIYRSSDSSAGPAESQLAIAMSSLPLRAVNGAPRASSPASSKDDFSSKVLGSDQKWLALFDQKLLSGVSNDQFNSIKEYIDAFISNIPPLAIYFVFSPESPQIKEIGDWLRQSLNNPKLIFDVKVDPSLIGGCAIVYKGVYKDYSLKAKIQANKEKLMEEFRKYFKN